MRRWRPVALLALGLTLANALAIGIGRALPPNDQIIFEGDRAGIKDLLLADVARAITVNLTRTPTVHEEHPAWSADGAQFAYIRQEADLNQPRQVCVRRLSGMSERCLPPVALWDDNPRWSPDGDWLLIESIDETFGNELYRLSLNDGRIEALTQAVGNDMSAILAPDGRRIVFVSQRDGLRRLYMIDGDGTARPITSAASNAMSPA
ncbi:MAG: PD40 domain-containing protein, partial [Anaerolineae bacterium]|nr:PD40 domain-containing protein [Anaerolineae bacterium]